MLLLLLTWGWWICAGDTDRQVDASPSAKAVSFGACRELLPTPNLRINPFTRLLLVGGCSEVNIPPPIPPDSPDNPSPPLLLLPYPDNGDLARTGEAFDELPLPPANVMVGPELG